MTPEDIAETVYIRLSETDDRGEHIRIIAGAIKDAYERAAGQTQIITREEAGRLKGPPWPVYIKSRRDAAARIRALGTDEEVK